MLDETTRERKMLEIESMATESAEQAALRVAEGERLTSIATSVAAAMFRCDLCDKEYGAKEYV